MWLACQDWHYSSIGSAALELSFNIESFMYSYKSYNVK